MNSPESNAALPTWLFIATDAAMIGAATVIAVGSPKPLSTAAMLGIVACVGLGAMAGLLPLVARYERQKNQALDERQRSLEALARTVSASAEQISIAAAGLHTIAEQAHKNMRAAEQLPHKLQEKIAEFQAQLSAANDAEKEELERELLALRTTESERLESVSQRIAKLSADWAKLETATHQHLTGANDAVARLAMGTANAIGKAQAAAEQALSQARVEAARAIGDAGGNATRAIDAARAKALTDLDARLSGAAALIVERVLAGLNRAAAGDPTAAATAPAPVEPASAPPLAAESIPRDAGGEPASPAPSAEPKRPRKAARDPTAESEARPPASTESTVPIQPVPVAGQAAEAIEEPAPIPSNTIPEVTPVAPDTVEPFVGKRSAITNGGTPMPAAAGAKPETPAAAQPADAKTARKRGGRKAMLDDEPGLGLELDEPAPGFASGTTDRVLTSDGATRLLVTAYIGIGNRLYIRGSGPGLSWDKGVPLQFVSIGKWRWETSEAVEPIKFKLYKNDDTECPALGALSLDPGHQHEVTAAF